MRALLSTAAVLGSTMAWLVILFAVKPFEHVRNGLDYAFGAAPAWTQVENMLRDPLAAEVSRGDTPLESFRVLAGFWAQHPGARRIILMGNSQSQLTSLTESEGPPTTPEKTYTDLVAERFRDEGSKRLFYRLSAGALSYEEMLWYMVYLGQKQEIKPDLLLVQLNYQNFMNTGIRTGMLELLSDAAFRSRIEEIVRNHGPDSFSKALQDYTPAGKAKDVLAPANDTLGYRVETAFRDRLDRIPAFSNRGAVYETFLDVLNRSRTYILHVGSVSKRSLKGSRIDNSRAALERLVQVSQGYGVRVILFQAPTNPDVPLYATSQDERDYHGFANSLATRYGLKIFDFEHSIPGPNWGKVMNLPDPLHLSRTGHQIMAKEMIARLDQSGM